jgi:hypothetical protein
MIRPFRRVVVTLLSPIETIIRPLLWDARMTCRRSQRLYAIHGSSGEEDGLDNGRVRTEVITNAEAC